VMNTILVESLDYIATRLEKAVASDPGKRDEAVQKIFEQIIKKHGSHI
jgi:glutamine synthetase